MKNVIADEAGVPELYVPGQTLRWRDDNNVEAKINYVRKVNGIDHYCVEYRNG